MPSLDVLVIYNRPVLNPADSDAASEAGVLEAVEGACRALAGCGHLPRRLDVGASVPEFLSRLLADARPDVVFNLCEGLGGTGSGESQIAAMLELIGLPLTGSNSECLALVRDKARTKWLLNGAGLPTPEFVCLGAAESPSRHAIERLLDGGPVIVKPACEDGSLGIGPESVSDDLERVLRAIGEVGRRYGPVLVERFIAGRELNAAIVELDRPELLPLAEIEFDLPLGVTPMLTYEAKWAVQSHVYRATPDRCPATVEAELSERIGRLALAAYRATGCRDYARVDFRVDDAGEPHVLEVNANPDLSPSSGMSRALEATPLGYDGFLCRLVEHVQRTRGAAQNFPRR